jgi:hypothetical protein
MLGRSRFSVTQPNSSAMAPSEPRTRSQVV